MRDNSLTRYRRLLRAVSLGLAAFAVVSVSGCATWRSGPTGAEPRRIDRHEVVEISVTAGEGANAQGIAGLLAKPFADAGYEIKSVGPNAPASSVDVARIDVSANYRIPGLGLASSVLSGISLFIIPGYASHEATIEGTVSRGDTKVPYRAVGSGKMFWWLPCILVAPFQSPVGVQADRAVIDIGTDLVRTVQSLPPVPSPTAPAAK